MRTHIIIMAVTFAAFALLPRSSQAANTFAGPNYFFKVDCFDAGSDIQNEGTKDAISVTFWSGDKIMSSTHRNVGALSTSLGVPVTNMYYSDAPQCGSFSDAYWPYNGTSPGSITHVTLQTSGSDAFFIDEASFIKAKKTGGGLTQVWVEEKIRTFGDDGGKGWCFSQDPKDVSGFSQVAASCDTAKRFDIKNGAVVKTSSPVYDPQLEFLDDSIKTAFVVDCNHSDIDHTGTKDQISVIFMNGSKVLNADFRSANTITEDSSEDFHENPDCDSWNDAYWFYKGNDVSEVTSIIVQTDGFDGFFIDEAEFTTIDESKPAGKTLDRTNAWGADNGKGWCLSVDPGHAAWALQKFVDSCYEAIRFDVKTGKVYQAKKVTSPPFPGYRIR